MLHDPDTGTSLVNVTNRASADGTMAVASFVPILSQQSVDLAARTRPVAPMAMQPWLGLYEQGFSVQLNDADALHLDHDIRSMPLVGLDDGSHLVADGPGAILEHAVTFATGSEGDRIMSIAGFDPVRWLTDA